MLGEISSSSFEQDDHKIPLSSFIMRMIFLAMTALKWSWIGHSSNVTSNSLLLFFSITVLIVSLLIMQRQILNYEIKNPTLYTLQGLMLGAVISLFISESPENNSPITGLLLCDALSKSFKIHKALFKSVFSVFAFIHLGLSMTELIGVLLGCYLPFISFIWAPKSKQKRPILRRRSSPVLKMVSIQRSSSICSMNEEIEEESNLMNRNSSPFSIGDRPSICSRGLITSRKELMSPPRISESELGRAFESSRVSEEKQVIVQKSAELREEEPRLIQETIEVHLDVKKNKDLPKIKMEPALQPKLIADSFIVESPGKLQEKEKLLRWKSL